MRMDVNTVVNFIKSVKRSPNNFCHEDAMLNAYAKIGKTKGERKLLMLCKFNQIVCLVKSDSFVNLTCCHIYAALSNSLANRFHKMNRMHMKPKINLFECSIKIWMKRHTCQSNVALELWSQVKIIWNWIVNFALNCDTFAMDCCFIPNWNNPR